MPKPEKTVVHVVMGNDFPQCVFSTFELAQAYCETMNSRNVRGKIAIWWRVYDFPLLTEQVKVKDLV